MSKLEELIQKYCPDGVEYVKLGDLEDQGYIKLGRGNVISKQDMKDCPGDFPVYSSSSVGDGEIGRYGKYMFDDERISWSIDGGGKFFYRNNLRYSITNVSGWLKVLAPKAVSTKYLYYTLTNEWVKKVYDYTHKAHPSVIREEYIIPVPPLPVQEEIVRVLDTFTELQAELQAELQKRLQQYNYYRDNLLSFEDRTDVEWKKLGEIGKVCMCKRIMKDQTSSSGDVPFYKIGTFGGDADAFISKELFEEYKNKYSYPNKGDILISAAGTIGRTVVFDGKASYFQDSNIVWLKHNESVVLNSFLRYCYAQSPWAISTGGTIARLYNDNILNAVIPVPSISEQQRIVDILDRFDALTTDLSQGLPAEIEKRRQQYEFYRDKLLTFKRKEA